MKESKLRPKVVLWWGIGLTIGGLLLAVLVPNLSYTFLNAQGGATVDQGLMLLLDVCTRIIMQAIAPVGVALIGASVVMAYVGRLLTPAHERVAVADTVADED
ncbi:MULTISPECIES: hypothetical protein [unclassified Leifsonia]|uniref:hypothetical protein n=1 Tax=unclassified Leifsonia TaxID=2663824 RepID=UPI0008A78D41|nr:MULTISPECIES: hypothetical protein [unclassified Leifsonia]SEH81463.1 hypothetical protein SAMN04515694_104208 [Leifsonia sp. CL154]SFL43978.1 hypothetical protein SAMN04515692_104207 [Leifsonia sp. CL147]